MITTYIRQFVHQLPLEQIFSTRECLNFGSRGAVDQALSRLVRQKEIVRLARGLFVRAQEFLPSAIEVCRAKARAFGKEIAIDGQNAASEFKLSERRPDTFLVSGCSSSFAYFGGRIEMKNASAKKMKMADNPSALAIRALWYAGKELVCSELVMRVLSKLTAAEVAVIRSSRQWMPAWLAQQFASVGKAEMQDRSGLLQRFEELEKQWRINRIEREKRIAAKVEKRIEEDRLAGIISTPKTVRMRLEDFS